MSSGLMMVIAAVFIITIAFSALIIKQFGSFEKKAIKAKLRQEEYVKEYLAAKAEEKKRLELEGQLETDEGSEGVDDPQPSE